MTDDNKIIQGLWIGTRLSAMEQLCIKSYQANGHEFHLYTYEGVEGVPEGTVLKNAGDIWLVNLAEYPSVICVADIFRYKLLLALGGWYSDMDMVCLKPFDFIEEYVFAGEYNPNPPLVRANTNIMRCPAGASILKLLLAKCEGMDFSKWSWPSTAPIPMTEAVQELEMEQWVKPPSVFNPIPHTRVPKLISHKLLDPLGLEHMPDAYAVHLWRGGWQRRGLDTDAEYHPLSLYEKLKEQYP